MTPVTAEQWARMSWYARRSYERRGGLAPLGHDRETRQRRRLAQAGLDAHSIEVVLGYALPTYDLEDVYSTTGPVAARESQLQLARLWRAGITHVEHRELAP